MSARVRSAARVLLLVVLLSAGLAPHAFAASVQGRLESGDPVHEGRFVDAFAFYPTAASFRVSLWSAELDPVLVVVSPSNRVFVQAGASFRLEDARSQTEFRLPRRVRLDFPPLPPETGRWRVAVTSREPSSQGGYNLFVSDVSIEPWDLARDGLGWGGWASSSMDRFFSGPPPPPPVPTGSAPPPALDPLEPGWGLLVREEPQREGFGLYTYVLCRESTDPEAKERCRRAIAAVLELLESIEELEEHYQRSQLALTVVPVERSLTDATADEVYAAYDHLQAGQLLGPLSVTGPGPFLLSSVLPVVRGSPPVEEPPRLQDLSWVPPEIVSRWVEKYRDDVQVPRTWSSQQLDDVMIRLRTGLAVIAEGSAEVMQAVEEQGFVDLGDALRAWVKGP